MSIKNQLDAIERRIQEQRLDSKVHFFDSHEECDEARKNGLIGDNDICFIDTIGNEYDV